MGEKSQISAQPDYTSEERALELENQLAELSTRIQLLAEENRVLRDKLNPTRKDILMTRILDILPVGVWLTDKDGKIIQVNIAAQLIWSGSKMVGIEEYHEFKGWWLDSGNPVKTDEWAMARAVRKGETCLNEEIEIESFDGKRKIVSVSAIPIFSGAQEIGGAIVVFEDISLRKRAEMALKQANLELEQRVQERTSALRRSNQDLEDFAFVASHDLQEPLRKVMSFGKLLMDKTDNLLDEEERNYIERMNNAAERMSQMLSALLNYSRLNTHARPYQTVDLNKAVEDVLQDLEVTIMKAKGSVEVSSLPVIEAEPVQMRQLFQNLISNGLKFHKTGVAPLVKIFVAHQEEESQVSDSLAEKMVTLVVEDNGIGFEPELKERLYQPFSRLVGRSEYEGTGIGLSICRKIVERHGGSIEAYSQPGEGARFVIQLPLQQLK